MRKSVATAVLATCTLLCVARGSRAEHRQFELSKDIPGRFYVELAIDPRGETFLVTAEPEDPDTLRVDPVDPSSLMRISTRKRILRYDAKRGKFTRTDLDVGVGEQMLFAPDGKLWIRSLKTVVCKSKEGEKTVLELPPERGLFRTMALDPRGHLWVGGLKTGLYRIRPDLEWRHFTTENSDLPSNSMTFIHVASSEELWIALWYNVGVWQVPKLPADMASHLGGTLHDARSTSVPLQTVWTMTSDGGGTLWLGSGGFQEQPASLVRFDGKEWSQQDLPEECAGSVPGSVRRLAWDGTKLWVQASLGAGPTPRGSCVATLADGRWSRVPEIPRDADVLDIKVDAQHGHVWVATIETEERRTFLHRFSR